MQNESENSISLLNDELLDSITGGVNLESRYVSNGTNSECAGCGIALGRKSYKYQGKSYCSKCFMQLKKNDCSQNKSPCA